MKLFTGNSASEPVTLFRPVGLYELEKIVDLDARAFPPRLDFQPIFYPVLNEEYAREIAGGWNPVDANSGYSGFVTVFQMEPDYLKKFEPQTVGGSHHQELWVPAEELAEFNRHLLGRIKVTCAFFGGAYKGPEPTGALAGLGPDAQLFKLTELLGDGMADAETLLREHRRLVAINQFYWLTKDYTRQVPDRLRLAFTQQALRDFFFRHPELDLQFAGGFGGEW